MILKMDGSIAGGREGRMLAMARLRTSLDLTKIDFFLRNLFDRQSFLSFRGSLFETIKRIVLGKIPFSPIIQDSRDRQFSIRKDARSLKINPRITKSVSPFESSLFHDFEKKKRRKKEKFESRRWRRKQRNKNAG